jgi:cell wall-associated NlpC family hydrolase
MLSLLLNFLSPLYGFNDYRNDNYFSTYIEAVAKSKLGITYKWGGNGPFSYDCSGFTKEVFEENGIVIPRISKEQAKVGIKVKRSQLKKGDLIFFHSKNRTVVDHVGIYLGRGKFIHASRFHKQIVISPLKEYKEFFKWGRRLN